MANNEIMVKDLSTTSSLSTANKLMLLTDEANNRVQNITVENALANIKSSNANNALTIGTDKKLYTPDLSGEVGDLTNLITTDKTDIVSAINEVKGDTNAISDELIPASKGWLEEGEIYQKADWYGEKIYNDVYSYNHSTFDVSKFTKVGSPIITGDGIVSGITGANYIKTNYEIGNLAGKSYTIYCRWIKSDATFSQSENIYSFGTGYPNVVGGIYLLINRKVVLADNGTRLIEGITQFATTVNYIDFKLERDVIAGTYTLYSNIGNGWINEGTSNLSTDLSSITSSPTNNISFYRSWNYGGSIDLKEFSIFVDGYPAFMGNKTGIDTIKPADYTTVGAPTISADGVASGFSSGNYIPISTGINVTNTNFEIDIPFIKTANSTVIVSTTISNSGNQSFALIHENGHLMLYLGTSSSWDIVSGGAGTTNCQNNTQYIAKLIRTSTQYILKLLNTKTGVETTEITIDSTTDLGNISTLYLGTPSFWANLAYNTIYDLNSFKIYVNGDLVYQPCLLIPYTESSTGSNVVDVAYRDRVIDVFEQYGSANYYTIDEINQNATLPMGEVYGFIRQSDSDKIYKDLVPCYDSTKAIIVTLLGHYTAPADGYVCSPNMVLTLDPDNGYEIFSLTIMRNTQSMTMISCTGPTAFPFCLPVLKNDVLTLAADATVTSNVYFIPREGV